MFLHDFESAEQVLRDFNAPEGALDGAEVILASYTYESYTGQAYVLFRKDGHLYEVHGSHCSCYGLEDQWDPEEVTLEYLTRASKQNQICSDYSAEFHYAVGKLWEGAMQPDS